MTDFAREVDGMVAGALNPGERVLWTGHCLSRLGKQRKAGSALGTRLGALTFMLAGIVWLTVCLVGRSPFFAFFLGLGTLALTATVAERFSGDEVKDGVMYCRKQTVYVLTDQRAMVLRNCRTAYPVQSLLWAYADEIQAERVWPDGRGTVQFLRWDPVEQRWVYALRFFMVRNARSVAEWAIVARDAARK